MDSDPLEVVTGAGIGISSASAGVALSKMKATAVPARSRATAQRKVRGTSRTVPEVCAPSKSCAETAVVTRRNNPSPYDSSETAASRPLRIDEVEALILDGGRLFLKDRDLVHHLLERVAATIRDHRRQVMELHDDVDRIRAQRAETDHPLTRAAAALAALPPQDQKKLLDSNYIAALEALEAERERAQRMQLLAGNDINRVKSMLAALALEPGVGPETREKIHELVSKITAVRNAPNDAKTDSTPH
jgi:hypothetical protein